MTLPVSRHWKAWNSISLHHRLEDRLSELADYRKINGHCNVPKTTAKTLLANWVSKGANTGCT
jgi:hypothetical protein